MNQAKRAMAALALAATLAAGGAAVAIAGPTVAGAAESAATGTVSRIGSVLSGLVSDGTINQTQADAVQKALDAARPQGMGERRKPGAMPGIEAVASVLGMTADEVRTALQSGQSLAQIAAAKGVSTQAVVDAIVADLKTHLAEEVTSGEHTQAEADQRLSKATELITAAVNGQMPFGPGGTGGRGHGRGHGGPFGQRGEGKAPSASTGTAS